MDATTSVGTEREVAGAATESIRVLREDRGDIDTSRFRSATPSCSRSIDPVFVAANKEAAEVTVAKEVDDDDDENDEDDKDADWADAVRRRSGDRNERGSSAVAAEVGAAAALAEAGVAIRLAAAGRTGVGGADTR
jgi:hypothetical protein